MSAVAAPGGAHRVEGEIKGTAFALGSEFMLTAGHVVDASLCGGQYEMVVGLRGPDGCFKSAVVVATERLEGDVAILKVRFSVPGSDQWFNRFKWQERPLDPFELVRTVGYGYGMQVIDDKKAVVVRGFQGHVVSNLKEFKPVGWTRESFRAYELSFTAPRGMSGAPLMNVAGTAVVNGVVIGNSESKMLVFRSDERLTEGAGTSSVEHYEVMTLGVAVQTRVLLSQDSELLGGTVRDHLATHELLS